MSEMHPDNYHFATQKLLAALWQRGVEEVSHTLCSAGFHRLGTTVVRGGAVRRENVGIWGEGT